jgi:phytoene dehydrogenase-like protein
VCYTPENFLAIVRDVLGCPADVLPGLQGLLRRFATTSAEEKDRLVPETLGPWLEKHVASADLRRAMLRLVGMLWHRDPADASAGRAMQVFGGGGAPVSYIADDDEVGGAQGVMEPWARAIRARGGEIALGWKPVEIAIEGGRAQGVVAVDRNNLAREVRAPVVMLSYPVWELFDLADSRLFEPAFVAAARELSFQSGDVIGWQAGLRRLPLVRSTGEPDDHTSWNRLLHARDRQYRGGFQLPSMMSRRAAPPGKHLLELVMTRWFRGGSRAEISWRAGKAELEENIAYLRRFYVDFDECVEWGRFQLCAAPQTLPWWWSPLRRHGLEAPGVKGLLLATTTLEAPASVGLVDLGALAGRLAAERALELLEEG